MILHLRAADEEAAEVLLRPLRAEPGIPSDLVDFLVTRVAGGMLWARLEGRRDREFEIAYEQGQALASAGRLKKAANITGERIKFIIERAPTYMEMEDLVRSLDAFPLDPWMVYVVSRMRTALCDLQALARGIYNLNEWICE